MNLSKLMKALAALIMAAAVAAIPLAAESEILKLEAIASYYGDEFHGRTTSSGEVFDMNAFTAAHKTLPFGTMLEVTNLANGKKTVVRVNDRGPFVDTRELDISKAAAAEIDMIESGTARVSIRKLDASAVASATSVTSVTSATSASDETTADTAEGTTSGTMSDDPSVAIQPAEAAAALVQAPSATVQAPATAQPSATVQAPATAQPSATAQAPAAAQPAATAQAPAAAQAPATERTVSADAAKKQTAVSQWRIQLGSFAREDNASRLVVKLRKDGFNPAFEKTETYTRVVIAGIFDKDLADIRRKLDAEGYTGYIVRQEAW